MKKYTLVGYKPYIKKNSQEISGYFCNFAQSQKDNEENEFGTMIKCIYVPAKAFDICGIELGATYTLFTAFDSGKRCDVFAGLIKE